ncbi:PD-(D/E)XK nuclease family protein [Poritiphilus flavus]|uniref:PD-(D/E)XK nuclease family protein n=1 Tax=Poritiphilus flavus TaxID=2697053 RepID=A0A6L9ECW0_9FLAO|nr:PD-(D/E)XK nuclease family protein [Poritiphilus flavus]NAS12461.1 PD-(D/E)XK nuclease family protein [Poritiphilus flavus]
MKSFLEEVVDELRSEDLISADTTLVLPSKRAGTFLKNYIARSASQTSFAPEIYSIESFIEKISGLHYASNTLLLFELYQTYSSSGDGQKDSFYEFTKWGQVVLQDFNEIDRYLVDPQKIFGYLSAVQEVNHWSLNPENSGMLKNYMEFWNSLESLYEKFKTALLKKHIGYQGLIYRTACAELEGYLKNTSNKTTIFIGFNALNTAESQIIQKILSEGKGSIYWDTDVHFTEDPVHDAGHFIRQHIKSWDFLKGKDLKGLSNQYLSKKKINIIGTPKSVAQVKYVGELLEANAPGHFDLKRAAVVLGDETLLNPLVNSIPKTVDGVNITMGYPLFKTPVADLFSQFFELHLTKDSQGWFYKNVLALLTHNYLQVFFSEKRDPDVLALFQVRLKEENWVFVDIPRLQSLNLIPESLVEVLFFENTQNPEAFVDHCILLISMLKSEFQKRANPLGLEYLYEFNSLFTQLKTLISSYPFLKDLRSLAALYNELLRSETVDFRGEPLEGLQLMGMLESRNLDFETVIITSVNEGILPSGKSNNSFIPFDIKKEFGLPTYKEKDAVYTYHFYRLLQRAKNIFLLYNTEPDVLEGGERSRLIAQLLTESNKQHELSHIIASPEVHPSTDMTLEISKDRDLLEKIQQRALSGFSPTALARYIRNPMEFYKVEILGIREVAEVEETIAANTMGTIVHHALEVLYKPFIGQFLSEDALKALKPDIKSVVESCFVRYYSKTPIKRGKNLIAFNVILRYIENFVDQEILEVKKHRIKILALELREQLSLSIPSFEHEVVLKGTVDRIDEKDGLLRIIDYKTGSVSHSDLELIDWADLIEQYDKSKAFQLLCYVLLYHKDPIITPINAGVISFKNLKSGFLPFATKEKKGSRSKDMAIVQTVLDRFKEQLIRLISEICDPEIPFKEKEV